MADLVIEEQNNDDDSRLKRHAVQQVRKVYENHKNTCENSKESAALMKLMWGIKIVKTVAINLLTSKDTS
ncbi:hypothetical protein E2C01_077345 [Portunus trituberculatus]|uniref:Uncharacterized protein n=1 Tax=Portunus trituberculatus TaxID=210409 RepID=A0A5B7IM11_PORTR|nr:hypothetical protein [Portunus trituberculatus]